MYQRIENDLLERLKETAPNTEAREAIEKLEEKVLKHQFSIRMTDEEMKRITQIKRRIEDDDPSGRTYSRSKIIKMLLWENEQFSGDLV